MACGHGIGDRCQVGFEFLAREGIQMGLGIDPRITATGKEEEGIGKISGLDNWREARWSLLAELVCPEHQCSAPPLSLQLRSGHNLQDNRLSKLAEVPCQPCAMTGLIPQRIPEFQMGKHLAPVGIVPARGNSPPDSAGNAEKATRTKLTIGKAPPHHRSAGTTFRQLVHDLVSGISRRFRVIPRPLQTLPAALVAAD